jgi:hypothetical protein
MDPLLDRRVNEDRALFFKPNEQTQMYYVILRQTRLAPSLLSFDDRRSKEFAAAAQSYSTSARMSSSSTTTTTTGTKKEATAS